MGTVAVLLAEEELMLLWLTLQWRGFWTGCTNGYVFSVSQVSGPLSSSHVLSLGCGT